MPLRCLPRLFILAALTLGAFQPALAAPTPRPIGHPAVEDATPAPQSPTPEAPPTLAVTAASAPQDTAAPEATAPLEPASPTAAPLEASPTLEPSPTLVPELTDTAGGASLLDLNGPAAIAAVPPAPTGCSLTTVTFANPTIIPLPDPGVITGTLTVAGLSGIIWDVNLITNIVHSNTEDLDIRLISPEGTTSTISTDNGLTRDNLFNGTQWDDQATLPVTELFPVSDTPVPTLVPEEAMAAFLGESPNGNWRLQIADDTDNGTGGQHGGWSLQITTLPVYPHMATLDFSAEDDVNLVDDGTVVRTLNVAGAGTVLGELQLTTEISHARNDNLDIYLVSPTGITVTISTDNGGTFSSGYLAVTWWDRAGAGLPDGAVTDAVFVDNSSSSPKVAEGALAAYAGLNPNGAWKLIITDDLPTNTGQLKRWALQTTTYDCRPDVSVTDSSVGLYSAAGLPLTYTIQVANVGGHAAQNVAFQFELLSGGTLPEFLATGGWQCAVPVGSNTKFQCSTDTLPRGLITILKIPVTTSSVPQRVQAVITATTTSTEVTGDNNTEAFATYAGLLSANGNPWDVRDAKYGGDDGAVNDGGQDAFDTWGGLKVRVSNQSAVPLTGIVAVQNLGLTYAGNRRWANTSAPVHGGVAFGRLIWAPAHANWVRYVDLFSNTTANNRQIELVWGGNLGSDSNTTVAATSTGDTTIHPSDTWVLTIQSSGFNPNGPAADAPVGAVLGSSAVDLYNGADNFSAPFAAGWTGNGNQNLGHTYAFIIPPHTTVAMAYFLYRGLAEGVPGPAGCTTNCVTPNPGTQITQAQSVMIALVNNPPLCDLPLAVLSALINWPEADECQQVFVPFVIR